MAVDTNSFPTKEYQNLFGDKCIYVIDKGQVRIEDPELGIFYNDALQLGPCVHDKGLEDFGFAIHERKRGGYVYEKYVTKDTFHVGQFLRLRRDGTLLAECYFRASKLHGPSLSFYPNSQAIATSTIYIDGKKEGKALSFFENGSLECMHQYVGGVFHGLQKSYYLSGKLKSEIPYKRGILDGIVKLYYDNGSMRREISFRDGKRFGPDCEWDADGVLVFALEYENGHCIREDIKDPIQHIYQLLPCKKNDNVK
jgi:antitoxin component YwqK of YwqJK toxin-antitoxin module